MFIGREEELKLLEQKYKSKEGSIIVVYGRRRVGKSLLIKEFIKSKKNTFYFNALEKTKTTKQISYFVEKLQEQFNDFLPREVQYKTWNGIFSALTDKIKLQKGKFILCLDEFQWMASGKSQLVSLVKSFWDDHWKKQGVMLVLCGSVASFMVNQVIHSKALYGRISSEILLEPLFPSEAAAMFKGKRSKEEVLKYLLIFGGIPKYIEEINLNMSFNKNLNRLCFNPRGFLFNEKNKIFYGQFKETKVYNKIVMALKDNILNSEELARKVKVLSGGGFKGYLDNLVNANIISEYMSFGSSKSQKSKKYKVTDEYLIFYYKYIKPHTSLIKSKVSDKLFENICDSQWDSWLGFAFERFCIKNAAYVAKIMGFADEVIDFGPLFGQKDKKFQVDLLYERASKIITLCEIKYHNSFITPKIIPELNRKCELITMPKGYTLERALISIHGMDESLEESEYFHHSITLNDFFGT